MPRRSTEPRILINGRSYKKRTLEDIFGEEPAQKAHILIAALRAIIEQGDSAIVVGDDVISPRLGKNKGIIWRFDALKKDEEEQ